MLDTNTKKRIDDCRDILVGKLPDPKAQIEQITIGLIYKFMDDMDRESIELGGTAKFFSGDYEKYAWDKLFDTKVSATEMLNLYSDAILSMDKNPNIPQLFRDIFKNAFLPYRDPETLKLFLKTIGEFEYTHSEKLGDAFEYLLSVMGSQGDAGQFRTPRHIIDFLVAIVDPDLTDTILDPACGTAGFLISAFKHIKQKYNNQLTPDQRKKLINNFIGYDISPDMVRLSLVNLYLHGFSEPHIYEYDTLSSEVRWADNFDVILANPPFMSPKGGIRPHKRFTIQSKRSEVLFVDYIAEHLNPKGKAGIIVPEGVIFQSGKAYKELRKMLILLLSNLFYDFCQRTAGGGAQGNISPKEILSFEIPLPPLSIQKEIVTEIAGYQKIIDGAKMVVDNYKPKIDIEPEWEMVELGELCKINGSLEKTIDKNLPYIGADSIQANTGQLIKNKTAEEQNVRGPVYKFVGENILYSKIRPYLNKVTLIDFTGYCSSDMYPIIPNEKINISFLHYFLLSDDFNNAIKGYYERASIPKINRKQLFSVHVPLPPIKIQLRIVNQIKKEYELVNANKELIKIFEQKIKDRIGKVWGD